MDRVGVYGGRQGFMVVGGVRVGRWLWWFVGLLTW